VRGLVVKNLGASPASFDVSTAPAGGVPHTTAVTQKRVRLGPGERRVLLVSLGIPAATAGDSTALRDASGFVTLSPATPRSNGGIALRVPYYAVAAARARVYSAFLKPPTSRRPQSTLFVTNFSRSVAGTADFYEWGLWSPNDALGSTDLSAAGVQSWDLGSDHVLVFALSTYQRWSSAAAHEFDVLVDVDGDGVPDKVVVGIDLGLVTTGAYDGVVASMVLDLATGNATIGFLAVAPTDGSTILLPVWAADLGLSSGRSSLHYTAQSFDGLTGASDAFDGWAAFDAWSPALSQPDFLPLDPWATVKVPYAVNLTGPVAPPRGVMVVKQENRSGRDQVDLIPLLLPR
jgi:hypothetical protein